MQQLLVVIIMFGYINIDKDKLTDGERGLYQTFMCGLCVSTKQHFSNFARATVNYDINFYNVLLHSYKAIDVTIDKRHCIASPFKKRTIMNCTTLTDRLAIANVLLVYLNVYDDVLDGGSWKKKTLLKVLSKDYKKASTLMPELSKTLNDFYEQLRTLEQQRCDNLDKVCHPFASMTVAVAEAVLQEPLEKNIINLCYNTGKWIYLIDALDDIQQDIASGNYNPLVTCCHMDDRTDIESNVSLLNFIFFSVLNRLAQCYNDLNLSRYHCILNNIIHGYVRQRTKQLIASYQQGYKLKGKQKVNNNDAHKDKYKLKRK